MNNNIFRNENYKSTFQLFFFIFTLLLLYTLTLLAFSEYLTNIIYVDGVSWYVLVKSIYSGEESFYDVKAF